MTTKTRNRFIVLFILAFPFMVLSGFLASQIISPLSPIQPLPNPNGYDDFLKAGQLLPAETPDYDKLKPEELRQAVSANAAALSLARDGLSNQCRVPIQFSETYISNHLNDLAGLKRLAQAFAAEGRLAEMENRPDDAARSYLDTIHFANESSRGGPLIDELVGIAIESIGTIPLQKLVPKLDASTCRETANALEVLDSNKQSWDELMQQENAWSHAAFRGWRYKLMRLIDGKSMNAAISGIKKKFKQEQMRTRQLIIDLAARAYELDKGRKPASLADLVPDYLKAVPQDPFTGTDMVYLPR